MNEQEYTDDELIEWMIQFYMDTEKWPKLRDMRAPYPGKTTYARRFASVPGAQDGFGNALKIAQERYDRTMQAQVEKLGNTMDETGMTITGTFTGAMSRLGNICKKIRGKS